MPKTKKLQNQIQKKLDQLLTLLDQIDEVSVINPDEPETWDSDALYNLVENLKETLKLLEDQEIKGQYEEGLCSLVDSYQNEAEDYA